MLVVVVVGETGKGGRGGGGEGRGGRGGVRGAAEKGRFHLRLIQHAARSADVDFNPAY